MPVDDDAVAEPRGERGRLERARRHGGHALADVRRLVRIAPGRRRQVLLARPGKRAGIRSAREGPAVAHLDDVDEPPRCEIVPDLRSERLPDERVRVRR